MMDDLERERRLAEFDTGALLRAVDDVDLMRGHLDGDGYAPPEIRNELLRLHQLAFRVVRNGWTDGQVRREMFELAEEIEARLDELGDALDRLRDTLGALTALEPQEQD